jgi:protein SCO1
VVGRTRRALAVALLPAALLLTACGGDDDAPLSGAVLDQPYVVPETPLTDTDGASYSLTDDTDKRLTLVFFGYTHCPDVCIAVLSDVSLALQRLTPADRDQIQLIFITTDPARDKEKRIRRYLDRFSPSYVGLTGPMSTIKRAAGEVGVEIEGLKKLPSGGYEVGHSAQVIGFSRNSGVVIWTPGTPIGALKQDFALLVERSR